MGRGDSYNREKKGDYTGGASARRKMIVDDARLAQLGTPEYQPKTGEKGEEQLNAVHLLPFRKGDPDVVAIRLFGHDIGDGFYVCPEWMATHLKDIGAEVPEAIAGQKCPACARSRELFDYCRKHRDTMTKEENDGMFRQACDLQPHYGRWNDPKPKRFLVFCVDAISREAEDEGPKVWLMPLKVFTEGFMPLSEDEENTDTETGQPAFVDLQHPDHGYVFKFKRSGLKRDTKYSGYKIRKRDWSIAKETDWLTRLPSALDVINWATADEIAAALGQEAAPAAEPAPVREGRRVADEVADEYERGAGRRPPAGDDEPNPTRRRPASGADSEDATETASPSEQPRGRRGDYYGDEDEPPAQRRRPAADAQEPSRDEQDAMRERIAKARAARAKGAQG